MRKLFVGMCFCLAAASLGGCGLIYTNVTAPRQYRSATPSDVKAGKTDKIVTGKSCATAVLFLFAWGDIGYDAATRDALKNEPDAVMYDVKSDLSAEAYVLGAYTHACTIVTGKVAYP